MTANPAEQRGFQRDASGRNRDECGMSGPRVVYLLMTYNHEKHVADAVRSALAQTYSPLEIWISDDSSSDSTFDIIYREVARYSGPHKVMLNRNGRRLGSVEHLVSITEKIGHAAFYVTAHGDDMARPHRTQVQVDAWRRSGASMITCAATWLNISRRNLSVRNPRTGRSRFISAAEIILRKWRPQMLGATMAFEPEILSHFEPLDLRALSRGLDHVLPLRAAAMKGLYYIADRLVDYRLHEGNMSNPFRDRNQPRLVLKERHAAYELTLGAVQLSDMLRLAQSNEFRVRYWLLASLMKRKQHWRLAKLQRLRKTLASRMSANATIGLTRN